MKRSIVTTLLLIALIFPTLLSAHCEIPCGIYGDKMRIHMLKEHITTIEKSMKQIAELQKANVIIVIAGMEGALASVVGGLVSCPVIAVPTSVGYGSNFEGLSALLTMLNSCAAGVTVVNIDNGFSAAVTATLINRKIEARK